VALAAAVTGYSRAMRRGDHADLPAPWAETALRWPGLHFHALGPRTFVLRQSLQSRYEAPFMYLLAWAERALAASPCARAAAARA